MGGRMRVCLAAVLGMLWLDGVAPGSAAAGSLSTRDRMQHDLDAMARHGLCARDDAGLKQLHRDLSKPSAARIGAKR